VAETQEEHAALAEVEVEEAALRNNAAASASGPEREAALYA
jgi:hypothetical protein